MEGVEAADTDSDPLVASVACSVRRPSKACLTPETCSPLALHCASGSGTVNLSKAMIQGVCHNPVSEARTPRSLQCLVLLLVAEHCWSAYAQCIVCLLGGRSR